MNLNYKIILFSLIGLLFFSCENDEEAAKPNPQVLSIELGIDNSKTVLQGNDLLIKAQIKTEGLVKNISIQISSDNSSAFTFDTTYNEFENLSEVQLEKSIVVPLSTAVGMYELTVLVTDITGNSASLSEEFEVLELNLTTFSTVNGFVIANSGEKYLATNLGLYVFTENEGTYSLIESPELAPINTIAKSNNANSNEVWLGSNDGAYNYTTQELLSTNNSGLHNNIVSQLSFGWQSDMYLGTDDGIAIKDPNGWFAYAGKDTLYNKHDITSIGSTSDGYTYVATAGGGVERFKYDVDGISGATIFDKDWSKLKTNEVNTVYVYDTVQVYGTPEGVAIHFSYLAKWDWDNYTVDNGLVNNNVISIVRDQDHNLWFGTNEGLSMYDGSSMTNFTVDNDGLLSNNINFLAVDNDGSVWFACNEGLSKYKNGEWFNFEK